MSVTPVVRAQVAALLLALSCLAACGADEGPGAGQAADAPSATAASPVTAEPSGEPAPAGALPCGSVWREGATIPRGYRGCVEDGDYVARDVLGCSSGQRLVRHADRYYGVLGGTVHAVTGPLERDRRYVAAVRSCRG